MTFKITSDESMFLKRVADEPSSWLRKHVAEFANWEAEFWSFWENLKVLWEKYRVHRINLAFILDWSQSTPPMGSSNIDDVSIIQQRQNAANSSLIFEIDLGGVVLDTINVGAEIEPTSISVLSHSHNAVIVWFGDDLDIFCNGMKWNPKNKAQTLKEMKLKKRDLMPLTDYKEVLTTHYEQYIRGEAGVDYWFQGKKNKVLLNSPEKIFQKNLFMFLKNDCECDAALEPMFKDTSRCDVKATVDYDIYFFEIKWIGFSATKKAGSDVVSAENPREEKVENAIAGAYQTKAYIEQNNSVQYDNKIKIGVVVVYDGYPTPHIPINYPAEIQSFPLLDAAEFPLVTSTPSVTGKKLAKRTTASKKR